MDRRQILSALAAAPLALQAGKAFAAAAAAPGAPATPPPPAFVGPGVNKKGMFRQGVCPNVFGRDIAFEDGVKLAAACGVKGYDFLPDPAQWPVAKRHGVNPTIIAAERDGKFVLRPQNMAPGWAAAGDKAAQGAYAEGILRAIDAAAANGIPMVLVGCGTRTSVSYSEGADNTVEFFNKVKGRAEEKGIVLCLEYVNSLGVQAPTNALYDNSAWGWDVFKRINSKSVKSLYDLWHAELMEGNIGNQIKNNIGLIGHFHTGSIPTGLAPGRYELWRNNEIDYRHLAQVIANTGFTGCISHEWSPSPGSNVEEDLRKSIELMAV